MATGRLIHRRKRVYGAHPLHVPVLLASFALTGYSVWVLGFDALWNHRVWWQAIAVWFAAAIIAHDLILFPAYALLDRVLAAASTRAGLQVSPLNYIRVPLLGIGLSFLLFFPGIIQQSATTYHAATGGNQQAFLPRWLLLSATMLAISALAYAIRSLRARRRR
ncbi:hypothetical protein [Nocardia jiangxiensis]|uniref:Lipoprotein n=1 Tax=Nocardia jiangxiensis TaxID=282685 RepID=A0ABW6SEK4_9NOCA|nr:hypothetical protein [Nocardia jiangxiensis]